MTIMDEPQNLRSHPIDKERLRQKYLEERNKRLRADGNDQYLQFRGSSPTILKTPIRPLPGASRRTTT
jgi:hypothetical protein